MSARTRLLLLLLLLVPTLGFTMCQPRPNVPEQVIVTVEKFKPLPDWAKPQLPKAMPVDGTVSARNRAYEQRGNTIDYANCIFVLQGKLDAGEPVDPKECAQ